MSKDTREEMDFSVRQNKVRDIGIDKFMPRLDLSETIKLSTAIIDYVNECGSQELKTEIENIKEEFVLNNYVDLRN